MAGLEQSTLLPFISSSSERTRGTGEYRSAQLELDTATTQQLQGYAQKHRITVNTVMQGVWSSLLHHYTGSSDIVYGVVVSGRPDDLPGVENRVGMYINTLPLRSKQDEATDQRVTDWLQVLQGEQVSSRNYQYTPLYEIQGMTGLEGDLFDSLLVFENYPVSKLATTGERGFGIEKVRKDDQSNYPLTVIIGSGEQLSVKFSYKTGVLEETYVNEIRDHFEHVLLQIISNESGRRSELELLTAKEKQQLLELFNDTHADYPANKNILHLFEEQVIKTPGATALVFENIKLSYSELDLWSNKLANYLIEKGIEPGQNIGLLSLRGIEMIVAIFGILKTGSAYVPFNKEYPAERLQYIIEDAAIKVIVNTDSDLLKACGLERYESIHIKDALSASEENPRVKGDIDSCVYIMYTSGTTGRPKGIQVNNRNITKLVYDTGAIAVMPDDRVLQWSNYSFDGSTYDIYSSLLKGAALYLIKDEWASDVDALSRVIDAQKITVCFMTTALFNSFIDVNAGVLKGLRKILFGGEKVSLSHVSRALAMSGPGKIVHVYGPTETTVYAISYPIDSIAKDGIIPIGKPLSNTSLLVLDAKAALVPIGVPGELYIGGDGVSMGYINNSELSSENLLSIH
jgi:amino acid adenylation domain-containing protein